MKLWLDDVRKPPDESWTWCKSVDEALQFVRENQDCEEWALDHDLGGQLAHYGKGGYDWTVKAGVDFVTTLMNEGSILPGRISIHSTNQQGALNMASVLAFYSVQCLADVEIVIRPMAGRIMDRTPHYEDR